MLLHGCQIQVLRLPVTLGMAEMTPFNFSAKTLESRGNRTPVLFRHPLQKQGGFLTAQL